MSKLIAFTLWFAAGLGCLGKFDSTVVAQDKSGPILVVLDRSGSMKSKKHPKLNFDKQMMSVEGAQIVLGLLPSGSEIAIIPFSDNDHEKLHEVDSELVLVDNHSIRNVIKNKWMKLSTDEDLEGGTDFALALRNCQKFLKGKTNGTIVFLTDGEPNAESKEELAPLLKTCKELAKGKHKMLFIDIHPLLKEQRLKGDSPFMIEVIDEMVKTLNGEVMRLRPPKESKQATVELLRSFLKVFEFGDDVNYFKIRPELKIPVYPGAEKIIAFGLGGKIEKTTINGKEPKDLKGESTYQYVSRKNNINLLNLHQPAAGDWGFEMSEKGEIVFVISDPRLNIKVGVRERIGGGKNFAGTEAIFFAEFSKSDGSDIDPELAKMFGAKMNAVADGASSSLFEVDLKPGPKTKKKVVLQSIVKLPPIKAGLASQKLSLSYKLLIKASENNPWFLDKKSEMEYIPLKGSYQVKFAKDDSYTFSNKQSTEMSLDYNLPVGCQVECRIQSDGKNQLEIRDLETGGLLQLDKLVFEGKGEPSTRRFEITEECADEFFGTTKILANCKCLQGGLKDVEASTQMHFLKSTFATKGMKLNLVLGKNIDQPAVEVTVPAGIKVPMIVLPKLVSKSKGLPSIKIEPRKLEFKAGQGTQQKVILSISSEKETLDLGTESGRENLELAFISQRNVKTPVKISGDVGPLYTISKPVYKKDLEGKTLSCTVELENHAHLPINLQMKVDGIKTKDGAFFIHADRRLSIQVDDKKSTYPEFEKMNWLQIPRTGKLELTFEVDYAARFVGDKVLKVRRHDYFFRPEFKCKELGSGRPAKIRNYVFGLGK